MHLYVKSKGLKYNYERVQGCFCKNTELQGFSEFMELIF
jgi:hypothetical protein